MANPLLLVLLSSITIHGAALSNNQVNAWKDALASDPESAFGCIVAFNTKVTKDTANEIGHILLSVLLHLHLKMRPWKF